MTRPKKITRIVLDASALIAAIFEEKGSEEVEPYLPHAIMSTVNLAEVSSYMIERGIDSNDVSKMLKDLGIDLIPYDETQAFLTAKLRTKTKSKGLSLGDRACLALAITKNIPVLTADKAWKGLEIGIAIQLIR